MATKTLFKNNSVLKEEKGLTPEIIIGKLFWFHSQAHFLHLQTKSFAEHKALDELYKSLVDMKDEISEQLLGYINRRLNDLPSYPFIAYSEGESSKLCDNIMEFAVTLREWAENNGYENIGNLAQELSGLGASIKYLLTLK